MLSVGLTGSVASGKSTVAEAWAEAGVPVVSADRLAREAVAPGSEGLAALVDAFGEDMLADDGSLDRAGLRQRIFQDDAERRRLEDILHPRIAELRDRWLEARRAEGAPLVVSEIPLLFEKELEDGFDVTVLVDASRDVRLQRLVGGRGLAREEALGIMDAQMSDADKRARADVVLENDGALQDLRSRALALLDLLRARAVGLEEGAR